MSELILPIKQGEELNVGFTIKQDGNVMDLTDYVVRVQVKKVPLVTYPAMIDKEKCLNYQQIFLHPRKQQ